MSRPSRHPLYGVVLGAIALALAGSASALDPQPGSAVPCVEGMATSLSYYDHASCQIDAVDDTDVFTFSGTAGDEIRLVAIGTSGFLAPRVLIEDPDDVVVFDGPCDPGCESANFSPSSPALAKTGTYTVSISEVGMDDTGSYQVSLGCLFGCAAAPPVPAVRYVQFYGGALEVRADLDFFSFEGSAGTEIRLTSGSDVPGLDPVVEIRAPDGTLVRDASCAFPCMTALPLEGTYRVALWDGGFDHAGTGSYRLSLVCPLGDCDPDRDGLPDLIDNCGNDPNPLQIDTNGDGLGNACDPDFNGDGVVGGVDGGPFSPSFGCEVGDACYQPDVDLNVDGVIGGPDLGIFAKFFGGIPGPAMIPLEYGSTIIDSLGRASVDVHPFEGVAGTDVQLSTSVSFGDDGMPLVRIWAPDGTLLHSGSCDTSTPCTSSSFSELPSPTLPQTGTYFAVVSQSGTLLGDDQFGTYWLDLLCLSGACP